MSKAWVNEARCFLSQAGIEEPQREAYALLRHHVQKTSYIPELNDIPIEQIDTLNEMLKRRCSREPLAYILGQKGFWKDDFFVGAGCLIPRPESEALIECALSLFDFSPFFFEAGIGSGCLSLSLLKEWPDSYSMASDISADALFFARQNAKQQVLEKRIDFFQESWLAPVLKQGRRFDLIISNPPYVACDDLKKLQPEIALYEPVCALDGGKEGIDHYMVLAKQASLVLKKGGKLIVEIGKGQEDAIKQQITSTNFTFEAEKRDIHDIIRVLAFSMD